MPTKWELQKPAQPKVKKTVKSANIRAFRVSNSNAQYCLKCGFRVRGANHEQGAHHNNNVPRCSRG